MQLALLNHENMKWYLGEFYSHTLRLETDLGWTGLLIECNPGITPYLRTKQRKAWVAGVCISTTQYPKIVCLTASNSCKGWFPTACRILSNHCQWILVALGFEFCAGFYITLDGPNLFKDQQNNFQKIEINFILQAENPTLINWKILKILPVFQKLWRFLKSKHVNLAPCHEFCWTICMSKSVI